MRTTFTSAEIAEARRLLTDLPDARRAVQRMSLARLRHMDVPLANGGLPTATELDALLSSGAVRVDDDGLARANVTPNPSGQIFRVAVGVTDDPVPADWSAFDQRYQWFGRKPQSVASAAHLFVLAVGTWRSVVVGLYEAVSAGADKLPNSPDPDRWPWALGVKPLAAIPPPLATRVDGQIGPQSGLPIHVGDPDVQSALYAALAGSPPPPGPRTLEQRVQELEWFDLSDDILQAVAELGREAKQPAVLARAREIGGWTDQELSARAWYTGSGTNSHIEHLLLRTLQLEVVKTKRLTRAFGSSPYALTDAGRAHIGDFGVPYRTGAHQGGAEDDIPERLVDIGNLERSTRRHMELQDRVAEALGARGIAVRGPGASDPQFDLGFVHDGTHYVIEVKTGVPASTQQARLGVGQLLEYCHLMLAHGADAVQPVLCVETKLPEPWPELTRSLNVGVIRADDLEGTLDAMFSS
jgi:hypothetical protein